MLDLNTCTSTDIETFGKNLLSAHRTDLHSFEEAATLCARSIYNEFGNEFGQGKNKLSFALVRIYRLCRYSELLPEVQAVADPSVSDWMALMGTVGNEPAWSDRRTSQGHKAIKAVGDNRSPMLTAAFEQLGLGNFAQEKEITADAPLLQYAGSFTSFFHVSKALGSPFIPAQRDFVEKHQIQSVLGIGCRFVSGALYLGLCFSKIAIDKANAQKFSTISPAVSTLLALYDGRGVIWASA
jgi:hypothetical protein